MTDTKQIILTLQQYDVASKALSPQSKVPLPQEFKTAALQHLRWYLVKENKIPKEYINNGFCDKSGADVSDDTTFDTYVMINGESGGDKEKIAEFNVYYKTKPAEESKWTGMDETTKAFLAEKLDLSLSDQKPFLNASLNKLAPSFKADAWKASAGKPDAHAADMNEQQWGVVMRNNDLLSGKFFEGGDTLEKLAVPTSIGRARYAAFALKQREIPDYNITFDVGKAPPAGLTKPEIKFRIPRFQICDSSKVEVFETKSSIGDSMARNAFSQTTVEASVGGGGFGVSVGVKAGATTSDSSSFAQSSAKDESHMHISYMFPRVEVFLDVDDLELTKECAAELEKIKSPTATKEDADTFFQKFGHVFVPRVQLGGRLYSVEKTDSIAGGSTEEKSSALKAAASASVSGWGFQASVSASHENTKGEKTEKSNSSSTHSITWHADGGDTLLCNNPPAWCPTVHSYYNWRVMNQIGMMDIVKLIGKIPGYESIPGHFERIYYQSVLFKITIWNANNSDKSTPFVGMLGNDQILETSEGAGGNYSRRAKRHMMSKSETASGHTKAVLETSALKDQLVWEGGRARFKYGILYPLRFAIRGDSGETLYSVRRTTHAERYQAENVLYAGLNEEPNVLVMFRNIEDPGAANRAQRIGSGDVLRMDFYDVQTKDHIGWLKNDENIADLQTEDDYDPDERKFQFWYV